MSFQAMAWAVEHKIPTNLKMVLIMLANRTNHDTGQCNPSHKKLAEDCGMSVSSVKRAIDKLQDLGLLTITYRNSGGVNLPNQYLLHLGKVSLDKHPQVNETHGFTVNPPQSSVNPPQVTVNPPSGHSEPRGGFTVSYKTGIYETVIETGRETRRDPKGDADLKKPKPEKKKLALSSDDMPEAVSPEVWRDFLELRRARRAPLTMTALDGIKRESAKAGISLDDALRMCCERGWQSFKAGWVGDKPSGGGMRIQLATRHSGFGNIDYNKGVNEDGTFGD